MSFDALAWAAKQNTGSSGTKLVLLGLAECADRQHGLAFPSISSLVEFSCLDRKSVIANLDKLEAGGFISDTGRKVGRTGQIKVYQLHLEAIPKTEPSQKRNSSDFPAKGPKNGTRNKSEPDGGSNEPPTGRNAGKHLLPKDWVLPTVAELPEQARACAEQWTAGSYAAHGEAFICYWRGRRGLNADWRLTWANRVIALHATVMKDQKFGNAPTAANDVKPRSPMTPAERETMARYHEGRGEFDKADKLRREATGPPGQPIGRVTDRIAAGAGNGQA